MTSKMVLMGIVCEGDKSMGLAKSHVQLWAVLAVLDHFALLPVLVD